MADILDDFDWDAFEKRNSFQMSEKQNEGTVDVIEHTVVSGTVISITQREVVVNIGYHTDGTIQNSEFRYNPELKVGDIVDVYIESKSNHLGQLILSHKKARAAKAWERVNEALDNNETLKAHVKCRTKGGSIVDIFGMEAFMPSSQTDIVRVTNLDTFVGQTIDVKVVKINKEHRNVVVSRRAVVEENLAKKTADKTILKEIWQKHTEVQEQILRQRMAPIAIMSEESTIINEKLHVRVDTTDNTEEIQQQIVDSLDIDYGDCHFEEGYVLSPISNWQKLDESIKAQIRTSANKEHVTFTYYPVVDGSIVDRCAQFTGVKHLLDKLKVEYDFDKNNRLQISIEELNRLKENDEFNNLQLALPDRASAIIPTYPSIIVYLEKQFPGLKLNNIESFKNNKKKINNGVSIDKQVSVEGGYFTQEFLDQIKSVFELQIIIRKTKRFAIPERAVYFLKTKRTAGVLPHPKNFRPAYAGIHIMQERSPDTIRTPFFSFCRFAPAFRASRYAASLNALYATTLCALTSLPRKARREPTFELAYDASLSAYATDTPPFAFA